MFYINGNFVADEDAKISVLDLGLLRGYGVFDYLRTYSGRPFHLKDHLLRLQFSAQEIELTLSHSLSEIEQIILTLLEKNNYPESGIKIIATGGVSEDQITPAGHSSLIILATPLKTPPQSFYEKGIKATTTPFLRLWNQSKTTQYISALIALKAGRSQSAQEAIYLNSRQEILEGTTSNFFAFQGDTLITSSEDNILLGITREVVLQLASKYFSIAVRSIPYDELKTFDEAFLTSSTRDILPLVQIDNKWIGNGVVGARTKKLMRYFQDYISQPHWPDLQISRYSLAN